MSLIDGLPLEILQRVCKHLQDVQDFALASKKCRMAAQPILYSDIRIQYTSAHSLRTNVLRWITRLQSLGGFQCPRRLEIVPVVSFNIGHLDNFDDPAGEGLNTRWQRLQYQQMLEVEYSSDETWQPMVDLIDQLPGLLEVHYSCQQQMTPCVLDSIERKPNCRFFLNTCCVRSLVQDPSQDPELDTHELRLITSPQLAGIISTRFSTINDGGQLNLIHEVARAMASGISPGLKKVSLCYQEDGATVWSYHGRRAPRVHWHETELALRLQSSNVGNLDCLELYGKAICTVDSLREWAMAINFEKLKSLKIRSAIDLNVLRWLAEEINLASLRTLTLNFQEYGFNRYDAAVGHFEAEEANRLIVALFKRLPPLRTLHLSGWCISSTLNQIISIHGPTLSKLVLFPSTDDVYSRFDATNSSWNCPMVRELRIVVRRFNGDQNEVLQYEWLGKTFPNLRKLYLLVDGSSSEAQHAAEDMATADQFDLPYSDATTYNVRYLLRNHAIDSTLANGIFRRICSAKPMGSPQLEELQLRTKQSRNLGLYPEGVYELCRYVLDRDWLCTPASADDQKDAVRTKAIKIPFEDQLEVQEGLEESEQAKDVFQTVWPAQSGKPWHDSWYSFPLAG